MELENLFGGAKGKGTSGEPVRPKVPKRRAGADCSVVAMKRGNARGAKGAGHRVVIGSTGNGMNPFTDRGRQPSCGDTSRMTRDGQARFREGLEGQFPGLLGKAPLAVRPARSVQGVEQPGRP